MSEILTFLGATTTLALGGVHLLFIYVGGTGRWPGDPRVPGPAPAVGFVTPYRLAWAELFRRLREKRKPYFTRAHLMKIKPRVREIAMGMAVEKKLDPDTTIRVHYGLEESRFGGPACPVMSLNTLRDGDERIPLPEPVQAEISRLLGNPEDFWIAPLHNRHSFRAASRVHIFSFQLSEFSSHERMKALAAYKAMAAQHNRPLRAT